MASFKIEFATSVRKDFRNIPKQDAARILKRIEGLAGNPRPPDSKKLSGDDAMRIRIGVYRVIYEIRNDALIVLILRVGHRKDIYRK
ncbi:MAG TPA: type II toxin-antitoxin system RelE/ParE family toxin [Kiritimatiellia bacterium]|nr:type II toxin-antitoxin system RelE/ParE family toxin [Kiritimatiellia bacterium]HMP00456.1 type II toxin-antitoxin system RelE/ParE family toxin [Kiritimatiellia bacterium]